jgi:hypothetical protein
VNRGRQLHDRATYRDRGLAGVSPSDEGAKSWLEHALVAARNSNRNAKKRPLRTDQNELLADIEKSAKKLIKQLQLRPYPYAWLAFWLPVDPGRAGAFAGRAVSEDEAGQLRQRPARLTPADDRVVLSILSNIERAARTSKDPRKGRPREVGKQCVVNAAFAFFVRHSSHEPSGTASGPFAIFAHAFYAVATKRDAEDDGGLDRQIRQAVKLLPIKRARARHASTSHEKKQDS